MISVGRAGCRHRGRNDRQLADTVDQAFLQRRFDQRASVHEAMPPDVQFPDGVPPGRRYGRTFVDRFAWRTRDDIAGRSHAERNTYTRVYHGYDDLHHRVRAHDAV